MSKYRFLFFFLFSFAVFLFIIASPLSAKSDGKDLNILIITIDTLRADKLGCYGNGQIETPNIDSLADNGILFSRAFALTPTTLPSHTNIFLGTTPLYHGVHDNFNSSVQEEFLTLAEYLKTFDYATGAFIGAFPLDSRFGLSQGFDVYDDGYEKVSTHKFAYGERAAENVIQNALGWVDKQNTRWFLWIHCFDPHDPYDPPDPFKDLYKNNPYDGEVAHVDFALGRLLGFLKEKNLFNKTIVIFTSDHGESLGQHGEIYHGYYAYNSILWIPLILSIPGINPSRVDHYVSHIDIFPTLCDLLQIEKPPFLQGQSLLPAIKNKRMPNGTIYIESLFPYLNRGWAPIRGFIQGKEKFIDSPIPELYNLEKDFDEANNLAEHVELNRYRNHLARIIENLSLPEKTANKKHIDREAMKILSSLGYISSPQLSTKKTFGPEDDVKMLLPHGNRAEVAMDLYRKGDTQNAILMLKKIIEEERKIDLAYAYLAEIYQNTGRQDEALEVLELGIERHPSSFMILTNYSHYLISAERYDRVIQVITKNITNRINSDPEIWNCLGFAYWKTGNDVDAIDAFERAISLDNEYANVFNNLGALYFSLFNKTNIQKYCTQALHYYKKAIELDPNHIPAYNWLGLIHRKLGNLEEAIYFWEKVLELKLDFSETIYNLSQAYLDIENPTKALDLLSRYKEKYYPLLNKNEKEQLDAFIKKCISKIHDHSLH